MHFRVYLGEKFWWALQHSTATFVKIERESLPVTNFIISCLACAYDLGLSQPNHGFKSYVSKEKHE